MKKIILSLFGLSIALGFVAPRVPHSLAGGNGDNFFIVKAILTGWGIDNGDLSMQGYIRDYDDEELEGDNPEQDTEVFCFLRHNSNAEESCFIDISHTYTEASGTIYVGEITREWSEGPGNALTFSGLVDVRMNNRGTWPFSNTHELIEVTDPNPAAASIGIPQIILHAGQEPETVYIRAKTKIVNMDNVKTLFRLQYFDKNKPTFEEAPTYFRYGVSYVELSQKAYGMFSAWDWLHCNLAMVDDETGGRYILVQASYIANDGSTESHEAKVDVSQYCQKGDDVDPTSGETSGTTAGTTGGITGGSTAGTTGGTTGGATSGSHGGGTSGVDCKEYPILPECEGTGA